jgi:hypothetical protein
MEIDKTLIRLKEIYLDMIGRQRKIEGILTTFFQESTELTDPSNQESPRRSPSPKCRKSKTHHHADIPIRRQNLITKHTPLDKKTENISLSHHQPNRRKPGTGRNRA